MFGYFEFHTWKQPGKQKERYMITLHSKNYKIFQNFGFAKMGGGGYRLPYKVAKSGFEISYPACIYSTKAKKSHMYSMSRLPLKMMLGHWTVCACVKDNKWPESMLIWEIVWESKPDFSCLYARSSLDRETFNPCVLKRFPGQIFIWSTARYW